MQKPPANFCGLTGDLARYDKTGIVILPVPFDGTSTWMKGADRGPAAIIEASAYLEFYDIETATEVLNRGIHTARPLHAATPHALARKTYAAVSGYIKDNKFVVTLGGEHSVPVGIIKAYSEHYRGLSILHLDAHSDSRDSYEGSKYNHACVIARAREFTKNIVSVGIRSMDVSEVTNVNRKKMFFAHEIYDNDKWISKAVRELSDTVYVTIDVDVFDPGFMPSTGTPEPGGLGWYQVMKLLSAVAKKKNVVGFDVVELCPSSTNKAPDFAAAKLVYTFLSYVFARK